MNTSIRTYTCERGGRLRRIRVVAWMLSGTLTTLLVLSSFAGAEDERMKVRGVIPDPRSRTPVLLLEDFKTGSRVLPLWIGVAEANAILMALREVKASRPMTHDLLRNLIRNLNARVVRITINDMRANTFIATITVHAGDDLILIDSRPSDAVALALRTDAPIFASSRVLDRAGRSNPQNPALTSMLKTYGLSVQEITQELLPHFRGAKPGSILVTDVREGGPGNRSGLQRGDVVLLVNQLAVRGLQNFLSLLASADSRNRSIQLSVNRRNKQIQLTLSSQ